MTSVTAFWIAPDVLWDVNCFCLDQIHCRWLNCRVHHTGISVQFQHIVRNSASWALSGRGGVSRSLAGQGSVISAQMSTMSRLCFKGSKNHNLSKVLHCCPAFVAGFGGSQCLNSAEVLFVCAENRQWGWADIMEFRVCRILAWRDVSNRYICSLTFAAFASVCNSTFLSPWNCCIGLVLLLSPQRRRCLGLGLMSWNGVFEWSVAVMDGWLLACCGEELLRCTKLVDPCSWPGSKHMPIQQWGCLEFFCIASWCACRRMLHPKFCCVLACSFH